MTWIKWCKLCVSKKQTFPLLTDIVAFDKDSDPEEWRGAPIGFQLVGRRLEEEKVLAMLQRVKEALE